jgi:hypothetical protein
MAIHSRPRFPRKKEKNRLTFNNIKKKKADKKKATMNDQRPGNGK